jgi:hypothetical protein
MRTDEAPLQAVKKLGRDLLGENRGGAECGEQKNLQNVTTVEPER